jgi:hypothetical protein
MKWLFFLLLAANLAFGLYVYLKEQAPNPDAQLMRAQLHADQIKIIPPPVSKVPAPQAGTTAVQSAACVEWGTFGEGEVPRAQVALDRLTLGERARKVEVDVIVDYWVFIPTLRTRAEMERKANELRELGIVEYHPVLEPGRWRYAISLGIFRNEDGARKFLASLRRKGVRSATVGNRLQRVSQSAFLVSEPTIEESASLVTLQSEFAGTNLRAVECPVG